MYTAGTCHDTGLVCMSALPWLSQLLHHRHSSINAHDYVYPPPCRRKFIEDQLAERLGKKRQDDDPDDPVAQQKKVRC